MLGHHRWSIFLGCARESSRDGYKAMIRPIRVGRVPDGDEQAWLECMSNSSLPLPPEGID